VQRQNTAIFAINFYRHEHQHPFSDGQLSDFESLAPALLTLAHKQIELTRPRLARRSTAEWVRQLQQRKPTLTSRELQVCARLLTGMTQESIALDLGLGLPTVKTYRNRAFARLGIHFKSELFALFAG
jgi:DNA-binding CsgD family transcriptional regulator